MKIDKLLEEEMKDPEFARGFEKESEKLDTAIALYKAREEAGLTQADLAERAHTTQATIARIERGDNVSFEKLSQIANALGKRVKISLI
ncbi:helix-turn-helix domain-containing protein [Pediococcus argentinicus]|uniref:HTH cro/C1-type domain-containing protein n=1 Tax=Pediococcus argentinicus TaxID=480391 RepID=A0A0R2N7R9_9LACO|nr:helix-turn-helix transcriptional regulator [Pediococcus argentinicus]KRO21913.1 hypothetical protein IV88_GL001332 [Pediococcus argentinicus]NKZ23115.1 helix-turn-helix transcriptional regulator [Pediococcus argentinicus]